MNINATIFGQAIAFVIFVMFCMKYVWPVIINVIENRKHEIAESFASIDRANKEIYLKQIHAKEQLEKAKKEYLIIIEEANQRSIKIIEEAKDKAKKEHNRIIAEAGLKIEFERKCIQEELRKKIAKLIIAGAEKIIEHSINENINIDIINKVIAKL